MSELYDEMVRQQDEDQRLYRLDAANQRQIDYTEAARIFAVSAATDLPDEVVAADLDNLESRVQRQTYNRDNYTDKENGAPAFNKFAAENPYHLTVLERDRKSMTRLERAWHALSLSGQAGWATTEIADIIERQKGGDIQPDDAETLKDLRALVGGGHFGAEGISKFATGLAKQLPIQAWILKESADEVMAGGMIGGTIGFYGGFGLGAVPGFFGGMGAGFAAGRIEASGRLEGNLFLDQAQQLGMDPRQARIASNIHAAIAGPLEALGFGALTKRLPGFRKIQRDVTGKIIAQVFSTPTAKAAIGRGLAAYGEAALTEITTELGQTLSENIGIEYLKSQARDAGDERPEVQPMTEEQWAESFKETVIETIYGVGLMAGAGPVSQFYRESKQAYQAEQLQHVWKAMGEAAKDTELREAAPTKYEEFVNALSNFNKNKNVLVGAKEFDTYFQEQGIDPDEVAKSLGLDPDDVAEARDMDASIEIPIAPYLRDIAATEHHQGLMPHLKSEGGVSMMEAKLLGKNNPELVKSMEKIMSGEEQIDTSVDAQFQQDLTGQLVAAGMDPATAKTSAVALMGLPNMARRAGMDPQAAIDRFFGGVKRATAASLEKPTIDVGLEPLLNLLRDPKKQPKAKSVRGVTLLDFLKKQGGLEDQGGEQSARDLQLEMPGIVSKGGMAMDKAAELAFEAGYIAERDVGVLQEAIDSELRGEAGPGKGADPEAVETQAQLDNLEGLLGALGIDLEKMSNPEIVKTLDAMETFMQATFHGSPHKWDFPSAEFVGTGEGVAAYGWGVLYLAEAQGVAETYRTTLSGPFGNAQTFETVMAALPEKHKSRDNARAVMTQINTALIVGDIKKATEYLDKFDVREDLVPAYEAAMKEFDAMGHLYEIEIDDAAVAKMLDWDAPLSEQPESVRKALDNMEVTRGQILDVADIRQNVYGDKKWYAVDSRGEWGTTGFATKEEAAQSMVEALDQDLLKIRQNGNHLYKQLSNKLGGDEAASKVLKEAGVPGIRFWDGSSRKAGEGTRNIVLFDTKHIKQVKRDGEVVSKPSKTFFQEDQIEVEASAIAEILVSEIEEVQDFGDLTLTETMRVQETGKDVKVKQPASTIYNRAVKRRNVVKQLMDCVSG